MIIALYLALFVHQPSASRAPVAPMAEHVDEADDDKNVPCWA